MTVCPTAVVAAPLELVWANLVQWERYSDWADVHPEQLEPKGPATVGQTVYFTGQVLGRNLHFSFKVEELNPERHQIGVHAFFPFGLQEKSLVTCSPIDATTCRVQYG
ncbi:MAG: SRPBCC family protein [Anaerolineae bacterium]